MRGYYFITDSGLSLAGNESDVITAVSCGVRVVQYREKAGDSGALYREALRLVEICRGTSTRFIVNDRVDIALAVDADGVHLGQGDLPCDVARRLLGPGKIIGVSASTMDEAVLAVRSGADYLGVGPVFATATKPDASMPCGTSLITEIKRLYNIPVIAIGGIDMDNARDVIAAGADMVCAISAVVTRIDPQKEIAGFQSLFGMC